MARIIPTEARGIRIGTSISDNFPAEIFTALVLTATTTNA